MPADALHLVYATFDTLAVVLALASRKVLLRRLPLILALARPLGLGPRDATFVGWFGPMGVSAVFYLSHSLEEGVSDPRLFAAGTLAVAVSVLTAAPGRKRYARG